MAEKLRLEKMIMDGENDFTEFKESLSKDVFEGLSTDLASFANTGGGRILIGIKENKDIDGYTGTLNSDKEIIANISKDCKPAIIPKVYLEEYAGKTILILEVDKSPVIHSDKNNRFPYRILNITHYLDVYGIRDKFKERGILTEKASSEDKYFRSFEESKRVKMEKSDYEFYLGQLKNENEEIRIETLKDLMAVLYKKTVPDIHAIIQSVLMFLSKKFSSIELRRYSISFFSTVLSVYKDELLSEKGISEKIIDIAKDDADLGNRIYAIQFLLESSNDAVLDIMINGLINSNDPDYRQYMNFFSAWNLKEKFKSPLRIRLMAELSNSYSDAIKSRIKDALDGLRRS